MRITYLDENDKPIRSVTSKKKKDEPLLNQSASLPTRLGGALAEGVDAPGNFITNLAKSFGRNPLEAILSSTGAKPFAQPIDQLLGYLTGRSSENPITAQEAYGKATGTTPDQYNPESLPEAYAQRFLKRAPMAGALGGLPALGLTAASSLTGQAAEELGASPLVQGLTELGTELGLGAALGKIPTLGSRQKEAYKAVNETPIDLKTSAKPLMKTFHKFEEAIAPEADESVLRVVEKAKERLGKLIQGNKISPKQLFENRKSLYRLGNKIPQHADKYLDTLTDGINDFFAQYAAENPDFYKSLKLGDQYTILKKMGSYSEKILNKIPDRLFGQYSPLFKGAGKEVIKQTIGQPERYIKRIIKSPLAREHYFDMGAAAIKQNPEAFMKSFTDLLPYINSQDEDIKSLLPEKSKKSRLKIQYIN